jgi:hypothetical protein
MRRTIYLCLLLTLQLTPPTGHTSKPDEFVSSTPCDAAVRTFLAISADTACERITWRLTLSPGTASNDFTLGVLYGMTVPNTQGLAGGGTKAELQGNWATKDGARIRLTIRGSQRVLQLRRLDDNLLHIEDAGGALLVGNGGWSYTLNRRTPVPLPVSGRHFESLASARDTDVGVFDGRSPCLALAAQVGARVESDCAKLKWRLMLHRDPTTGKAGRYTLEGTLYRERPRTGRWSIERRSSKPRGEVIRLDPVGGSAFLSFIKADDNILLFMDESDRPLVGNADFSFTLNRVPKEISEAIRR